MRVVGFAALIAALIVALTSAAMDVPSFLVVIGATLAGMLAAYGSEMSVAFGTVFRSTRERKRIQLAIAMWERARPMAALSGGLLGTLIGMVLILENMDDPNAVGCGLAMALLSTLYGLILAYGVIQPMIFGLRQRLAGADDTH